MNDSVTLTLPKGVQGAFVLPAFAVAYAILPDGFRRAADEPHQLASGDPGEDNFSARVLVALKTPADPTWYAAFHRARLRYKDLQWVRMPSVVNGASGTGAPNGYYELRVSLDASNGTLLLEAPADDPMMSAYRTLSDRDPIGVKGLADLEGLLRRESDSIEQEETS